MKIRNRLISLLLAIFLVIGLIPITTLQSYAYTNVTTTLPMTFIKTGRVISLVKDYDDYYLMRENFAADGSYVENVVMQKITKTQYEAELAKGEYDVNKVTELTTNIKNRMINPKGGRLYLVNMITTNDNRMSYSFIGSLGNGYNNTISMAGLSETFGTTHSYLLDNNGRYFRGTTNTITGVTTLVPIEQDTFSLLRMTMGLENIAYFREIRYSNDSSGRAHFSDKVYSQSDVELITFVNDAVEINGTVQDVLNGHEFEDDSQGSDDESGDSFDSNRYGENYKEWSDEFNQGYIGSWQDPSYLGPMQIVEWQDPFWNNSDIGNGNSIAVGGYYDDVGNWIDTDVNGNPIPSVPGSFDSAGNFMPTGLNGYYDPDGVYHPLFTIDNDITISDNRIYIDNKGYFDRYGTWHEDIKETGIIYLYDGSMIYPEGQFYDAENNLIEKLVPDMWGVYRYGSWIIYPDGNIFDIDTRVLTLNSGTQYSAEITEAGNYFFDNGTIILASNYTKGVQTADNTVTLPNGSIIYENGIIEYGNDLIYNSETVVLPDGEMIRTGFRNGAISLGDYGIIYDNGHYAQYNNYGNLVTDDDKIIFSDGEVMLPNGYLWTEEGITVAYIDKNLNLVTTDGWVFNRRLYKGSYDEFGNFVVGLTPEAAYYDRLGNQIGINGMVVSKDKAGYYNDNGEFVVGLTIYEDGYYTCDGHWISNDGHLVKHKNYYGYKDSNNEFVMYDELGTFDSTGAFYRTSDKTGFHINSFGRLVSPVHSSFIVNMDGSISLMGETAPYYGEGLFRVDRNIGYYDEYGRFTISRINPYVAELNGFYDSEQAFHKINEIYKDNNGNFKLLNNPNFGLVVENGEIGFAYNNQTFTPDGLTKQLGKIGYYDASGTFIESNTSPFLGGFYTSTGTWIDKTYYTDSVGNICVNNGAYIYNGNYITPSGDVGYFNDKGEFVLNKINPYENGFYDYLGEFHNEKFLYRDSNGFYKGFGENFIISPDGVELENANKDIVISDYTLIYPGLYADSNGNIGVFNSKGQFINGSNNYVDGTYLPDGKYVEYSDGSVTAGNMTFYGKNVVVVVTEEGTFLCTLDGYSIHLSPSETIQETFVTDNGLLFNADYQYIVLRNGDMVPFEDEFVEEGFWINEKYYVEPLNNDGYYEDDGTFYEYSGTYGFYNSDFNFISGKMNPYINGFYSSSKWIGDEEPEMGYFNSYGIPRNGKREGSGYYDYEGTWHSSDSNVYIDISGNAHVLSDDAIGYKDTKGRLHLYGTDGYFDTDGTYVVDNTIMGYYNKDGDLKSGRNPSFEGFYDMNKRWFQYGNDGYYNASGKYFDSISGETLGYYNAVGEFTSGFNPYLNGFYGFNGDWSHGNETPISIYFDIKGVKHVGTSPYHDGFYDMNGSWYFTGEKGFYDKNGTYYNITTREKGYYDMLGIYYEGTNPYQHGYYDPNKNLHLFGQEGYYRADGTYVDINGNYFYYLNGGLRREGSNPNDDGFYDVRGNWHEFGGDGYYAPDGLFHEYLLIVSAFKVGSEDYILFEGIFKNTDYVSPQIKNTVQFSIFKDGLNTRFLDTGIKVSANAMISYDKATDILHAISIYNEGVFIEDADSCLLFYDGNIINLKNEGKVSIKKLKDKFVDADIDIVVAKSRIGEKYALAEMIETNKNIHVYNDGEIMKLTYPMVVQNGIPYVAVNDFIGLMVYNARAVSTQEGTLLTFTLKDNILSEDLMVDTITSLVGSSTITITYGSNTFSFATEKPFTAVKLDDYINSVIYMPAGMISILTGKSVELDTINYDILITTKPGDSPIHDT